MKKNLRIYHANISLKALLILFCGFFIFKTSTAQTYVSGGIYTSTTWTTAGSPYIVVDTVIVFPGYTLTIQPGVVVKFENQAEIDIHQSSLIAIGTPIDSITFTSDSSSPSPGIYTGVYLDGGSLPSTFNYCNFSYANMGINTSATGSFILKHSNFRYNKTGEYGTHGTALIDTCNFINNITSGLSLGGLGSSVINYCNFSYNDYGLSTNGYPCTVTNCEFIHNQTGLLISQVKLDNCYINHNQTGINSYGEDSYRNSYLDSNTVVGIMTIDDSIINCTINHNGTGIETAESIITGNTIEYNTTANIDNTRGYGGSTILKNTIEYSAVGIDNVLESYVITSNTIENDSIGINLDNSSCSISCNIFCNNFTYNIQYGTNGNTHISNNYWCLPDSAAIQATIYDGYQDANLGLVFFTPFDTAPCSTTIPCNLTISTVAYMDTICAGNSNTLYCFVSDTYPYSIPYWTPGGYSGADYVVTPTVTTTYTVVVNDSNGCTKIDSITIKVIPLPTVTINPIPANLCSNSAPITLSGTPSGGTFSGPGVSGNTFYPNLVSGTAIIKYTYSSGGCTNSSRDTIYISPHQPPPSICYVTVDTSSSFNTVYWQKTGMDTLAIDSVVIYRQNVLDNYVPIGEISVHAPTLYNDYTALPLVEPYFYALGIVDTCGGDTSLSNINETVFLQSSAATGTSVVNLNWNFYQGNPVVYYRILRDDSGTGNWHVIDSVQGTINAFSDRSAPINPGLRYMLSIDWNVVCTPFLSPYHPGKHFVFNRYDESYSNMTYLFPTGINNILDNNSINVYPNPVTNAVSISFNTYFTGIVKITDVLGQNVISTDLNAENGNVKDINVNMLASGVYIISLEGNGKFYRTKIIKM